MIFYLTAEATRLERALTRSDNLDDDLSLESDNTDEPAEKADIPQPPTASTKATRAPKEKEAAKRKLSSKTTVEGSMYSQYFISLLNT